jgi:hypothetical protein
MVMANTLKPAVYHDNTLQTFLLTPTLGRIWRKEVWQFTPQKTQYDIQTRYHSQQDDLDFGGQLEALQHLFQDDDNQSDNIYPKRHT